VSIHSFARPAATARPGLLLAVILVAQLMLVLDATIVNVALPAIQAALGLSTAGLSWVISGYALAFGGLLLLGARAGDLLGRRRTFLGGIALFTAASIAGGLATSSATLLAARAAQGVGAAFAAPAALALLSTLFPEGRERMRAIGYYTAVSIGGSAVGLVAGGILTEWASWRWVMFVNVPIGLALLVVAAVVLPSSSRVHGHFDLAGAVTSTVGMSAVVYGLIEAGTTGWTAGTTLAALATGAALLVAFVLVERRAASPITPLRLFRDRNRVITYVARLLMVAAMFGLFFFLTQFLQEELGFGPLSAGLAFLPLTACLFLSSQASARLSARVAPRALLVTGFTLSTAGLLWVSHLSLGSGYLSVLGPLVLVGLGNGLAFVPLTALALAGVDPADAGAASGLVNVTQQIGAALGLALLVTVFDSVVPGSGAPTREAFVVGIDRAFTVAAALLLVTMAIAAVGLRTAPRSEADDLDLELELEVAAAVETGA
jgi:EmrB/QacA subfamily drug resistance transporter